MAKTATKTNKKTTTTANRKKTIFNIDNAPKEKAQKVVSNKNLVKQIEKMYNNGMGPRRMGKMLNIPRHHIMRVIENLGLFEYAEGSYR